MQDTDLERLGEKVTDAEQLAQLDDVINEPVSLPDAIVDLTGKAHKLVRETFSTYKTKEVLKMLAKARGDIDIIKLIGDIQTIATPIPNQKTNEDGTAGEWTDEEREQLDRFQAHRIQTAMETFPTIVEFVPDLLLDFGALATITNRELRDAYDTGSIAELREEKRKWLEFDFDASTPLKLLVMYIPHIGINLITQELSRVDGATTNLLRQTQ